MDILNRLNQQNSFDNMICIADINSEERLKELQEQGYSISFTALSWNEHFPTVQADYMYCKKSILYTAELMYIDWDNYIVFPVQMYMERYISANGNNSLEEDVVYMIQRQMKNRKEMNYIGLMMPIMSEQSGNQVIYMLNLMLENEKPNKNLYDTFMWVYSFVDVGVSNISKKALENLKLCKHKEQKRKTKKALKNFPDEIKVYRGEGSKSTPAEKAISWTTDINTAYFFASKLGGEEAKLVYGIVKKEDVFEYISNRFESECIIYPGYVKNMYSNNFVTLEEFLDVLADWDLENFNAEDRKINTKVKEMYDNDVAYHDRAHVARVCLLSSYLYRKIFIEDNAFNLSDEQQMEYFKILMDAASYHDIGRSINICKGEIKEVCDEMESSVHGVESYKVYEFQNKSNDVIKFLIEGHCIDDDKAKEGFEKRFKSKKKYIYWKLLEILKDADALDRCRFGKCSDGLRVEFLRTGEAKEIIPVASKLLEYKV